MTDNPRARRVLAAYGAGAVTQAVKDSDWGNRPDASSSSVDPLFTGDGRSQVRSSIESKGGGPPNQVTFNFPFQSFCSPTLLQNALLAQPPGIPIVDQQVSQLTGWGLANLPSSESPVAVEFTGGGSKGTTSPQIIFPGECFTPFGEHKGRPGGHFDGFKWGLPFGWLGGGVVTLALLRGPNAKRDWRGKPEILYHQATYQVQAAIPGSFSPNWPTRFPWVNAASGVTSQLVNQAGQPIISIAEPTRVMMRLRMTGLVNPASMRIVFTKMTSWDVGSDGLTPTAGQFTGVDVTWQSDPTGLLTWPEQVIPGDFIRNMTEAGGVAMVDTSGGVLTGAFVDVQRWGRLT